MSRDILEAVIAIKANLVLSLAASSDDDTRTYEVLEEGILIGFLTVITHWENHGFTHIISCAIEEEFHDSTKRHDHVVLNTIPMLTDQLCSIGGTREIVVELPARDECEIVDMLLTETFTLDTDFSSDETILMRKKSPHYDYLFPYKRVVA